MNWTTEVPAVPLTELDGAIEGHLPDGLIGEAVDQLAAAKVGAVATVSDLDIPEGMHVGVEFAGETGPTPLPSVTIRVRTVEAPPEPVEAEPEEGVALGERGASGPQPVKGGVAAPALA